MFVVGGGGLRGYTMPMGDCVIRVGAVPIGDEGAGELQVSMVPMVRGSVAEERFGRDEQGQMRLLAEKAEIVFEQLAVSGRLRKRWFWWVGMKAGSGGGSLGRAFMGPGAAEGGGQLLMAVVPMVETAAGIREKARQAQKPIA